MKLAASALSLVLLFTACSPSTSEDKPQGDTDSGEGNPLTAPVDYLGAVNNARKSSVKKLDLINVNQAINAFAAGEGRHPRSLQEMVDEKYLPAYPESPTGMKFEYDPATGTAKLVAEK